MNAVPAPDYSLYLATLEAGFKSLPDKPEETAAATLAALWHLAVGERLSVVSAGERSGLPPLDVAARGLLHALITRRLAGEPLAHITGRQRFMGLELLAGPDALIPRHETQLLAQAAVDRARALAHERSSLTVIDVCTGSGNVALALAHHVPQARVYAADLSAEAVGLARRNAELLGLAERVEFATGDLLAPFDRPDFVGQVDVLTCNPPYISSGKLDHMPGEIIGFEPSLAFDGGPLGIRIIQRLITEAPRFLRSGGWLCFEIGLGQGPAVKSRVVKTGNFDAVESVVDLAGDIRTIAARRR